MAYEFGGPPGATAITLGLPILLYTFAFTCNDISGCLIPSLLPGHARALTWTNIKKDTGLGNIKLGNFFSWSALGRVLPGDVVEGAKLEKSGERLRYRFNALLFFILIAIYGQTNIGSSDRYIPAYGFAQEISGNTAQGQQVKKQLATRVQSFKGSGAQAWVTFMHTQMMNALVQSKEEGKYPECTGGRTLTANSNRLCLMERVPLCQYAWEDDTFKRAGKKNTPTWE